MPIRVAIEHRTTYHFDRPVRLGPHVVRLRPAPHTRTPTTQYSLTVEPADHFINWQQDPFGNFLARLVFPEPATTLSFTVDLVADLTVINPFDFFLEDSAEHIPFAYEPGVASDLAPYLVVDPAGPLVDDFVGRLRAELPTPMASVAFLWEVNHRVQRAVDYSVRMEPGVQTPDETLAKALGSCRDSGWLLVQIMRRLGLAARFVSGYLVQLVADEVPLEGPSGPTEDFTDLHAWCEVYVPGAGWIGLDPTSGLFAGEGHIPLACTPEPTRAAPVTGALEPAGVTFSYANIVRRVHEDPRVTKPYSPEQWARIDAVGHAVDAALVEGDVRLTQGGEPTFVSVDDRESAQWTVDADGPDKRELATELARRLVERHGPGPLVQHTQGKWYPGEPLPRWQIQLTWRPDGTPLWPRQDLLLDPALDDDQPEVLVAVAERFARALSGRLGIPADCLHAAYEDPLVRLVQEAARPDGAPPAPLAGVDELAIEPKPADARLAAVAALDADPGEPVGWTFPLFRQEDTWATTRWRLRRSHVFLVPGDSPMGMRLPLRSLYWAPKPTDPERSRFDRLAPLPKEVRTEARLTVVPLDEARTTAVCVEPRRGRLHVFLPPVDALEHALALLAAVEDTAVALEQPIVLEGYPLPGDDRVRSVTVAPDPGVIEVNVQPAASWPELRDLVNELYADARASRLSTETFALDGGHTGTGGGNHLTLGGPTPPDSAFLRRPDLLRSLLTYWQHHPSLSYVFSTRFIGPTSQAPRVDEGRDDNLYELEIAFGELERHGEETAPWLVDRLFRHLLTDVTGNTHRAEFCIDKLFSPDTERGRLGLVEMRGFEMPPHPEMALVQALLVRAIVARCWREPYRAPLVRWGTELHDRFLLPWWAQTDLYDVVDDLVDHGFAVERSWFAPFLEFRYPRLGSVHLDGVTIEVRAAIEPWLVLGEEVSATGTARYVDSSTERLQVRAENLITGRHVITCNGRPVPLSVTSEPGTYVGGVRYKAWQPWSALHPTIDAHTPLVFDLVDRWNGRAVGGCTYHVAHPGGRAYDRLPVNANEAEARRVSRFEAAGHTPGPVDVVGLQADMDATGWEHPRTLDLRRRPG